MPPTTGTALIILVAFALPGFFTVLIQERTFKRAEDPTDLDRLLRILYYSLLSYLLLAVVAIPVGVHVSTVTSLYKQYKHEPAQLVWRGAIVLLAPSLVIATVTRIWDQWRRLRGAVVWVLHLNDRHTEPTGWDYFFRKRLGVHVRATLKSGEKVFGYYGGESFAAYSKDGRDLYLETQYDEEDGWFGQPAANTRGIWVNTQEAVSIEFYSPGDANTEAPKDRGARCTPEGPDTAAAASSAEEVADDAAK